MMLNCTVTLMQQSLDRLANWANVWQLTMSIKNCAVWSLSSKPQPTLHVYFIDGLAISRQDCYVDLGVTIGSNLSFMQHINNIVFKAGQCMSFFRGFLSCNLSTVQLAFIIYIRRLL
jgi:hypothetical protein